MNIRIGCVIWQMKVLLDNGGKNGGYVGVVIWGSSFLIDKKWKYVYMVIGNLYIVFVDVEVC